MLEVEGLRKAWPGLELELSLRLDEREIVAVLGPSGCGKSTLLRLIAGLEVPDSGRIALDGLDLDGLPPEKRGIGMVFQDFALFPHLDVRRNIEYGPRMRGESRTERERIAREIALSFEIGRLLPRMPRGLSGGEQQRVALARTVAARPRLLLLDEPLSSLDASLRRRLRAELAAELRDQGVAAIHVTHDAEEAFAIADRILLMREGRIEASGAPEELYLSPPSAWAAAFLGRGPLLEVLAIEGSEEEPIVRTPLGAFPVVAQREREMAALEEKCRGTDGANGPLSLFFPASAPRLAAGSSEGLKASRLRGTVVGSYFAGRYRSLTLRCPRLDEEPQGAIDLELELPISIRPEIGEALELELRAEDCLLLPGVDDARGRP